MVQQREKLDDRHFLDALATWERARRAGNESLADLTAADAMFGALVIGEPQRARHVALHVLDADAQSSKSLLVVDLARRLVRSIDDQAQFELPVDPATDLRYAQTRIRELRSRLRENPHNPVGWVDLSRGHATTGSIDKAVKAMLVALGRGDANRFVLRSAARLFVHTKDFGRAYQVLARAGETRTDPWLLASELAVGHVAGQSPKSTRAARRLAADGNFTPFERSELLSAIATLELANGSDKRARKLFAESLVSPHENSLAQAEWASARMARLNVSELLLQTPESYEARARDAASHGDWKVALQQSLYWQHAEPFSAEPAIHASYIASVGMGDYRTAADLLSQALDSNPGDAVVRNNYAYALASLGQLESAAQQLLAMRPLIREPRLQVPYLATSGLVAYRAGRVEEGRSLYRNAIAVARAEPDFKQALAMVWLHFAHEESRAGGSERDDILRQARNNARGMQGPDVRALLERVAALDHRAGADEGGQGS